MAHIVNTLQPHFTGHVGPVRFVNGHAECDDPDLLPYFEAQADVYDVQDAADGAQGDLPDGDGPEGHDEPADGSDDGSE